jgi:hypothetical protein
MRGVERLPESLREHFLSGRHVGEPAGGAHLRGEARNQACGDHVILYLRLGPEPSGAPGSAGSVGAAGSIVAAGFRARGCPVAMATAAAACAALEGLEAVAPGSSSASGVSGASGASADTGIAVNAGLADNEALAERCVRRFEELHGVPRPAHRHALALVAEALRAALPVALPARERDG